MKTEIMSVDEVLTQLEAWGSENVRKLYASHGSGNNQYGVTLGKLRGLAKKPKTNPPLALQLWATGNSDAMMLAAMLMDPAQLSQKEIERMVEPLEYYKLIDELVYHIVAKTSCADVLRKRWMDSPNEMVV